MTSKSLIMKKMDMGLKGGTQRTCTSSPPPPPPAPPLPKTWVTKPVKVSRSVTREEIDKYWRQKKMEEEDHLLDALKAAARIRARNLTDEDYKVFEESLKEKGNGNTDKSDKEDDNNKKDDNNKELRVGIKDWWTKSKYAYLNQPAIKSVKPKRASTYIPNYCCYSPPPPPAITSFGVI